MKVSIMATSRKDEIAHSLSVKVEDKGRIASLYLDDEEICTVLLDDLVKLAKVIIALKSLISEV